jgi:hypothetical protein
LDIDEEYSMKKTLIILFFVAIAVVLYDESQRVEVSTPAIFVDSTARLHPDEQWLAGQQVQGSGMVLRVLPDDNDGSRHQRFILELSSGRTVLVAHNIDLAPRIVDLQTGDAVSFFGEFETNNRGGVIHWTHRDPQGRHPHGWLEHRGQRYE